MNIEKLANNALQYLMLKESLPNYGILAGGSLANLIWEQVSGNIAIINDIDIFLFDKMLNLTDVSTGCSTTKDNRKLFYHDQDKKYYEDYTGISQSSRTNDFYLIENVKNSGLINYIDYSATNPSPDLIITSFDINCTQIAYDLSSKKFHWTPEFADFLNTGKLKFTNLCSPNHSAIRILKKRDELNAILDEEELKLTAYVVSRHLQGITRMFFSDKYCHNSNIYLHHRI